MSDECSFDNKQTSLMGDVIDYAFENAIPLFSTIEILQNCNFSCVHCYNYDRTDKGLKRPTNLMSSDKIMSVIEELINEGAFYVALTGGEPLLHPNLFKFIDIIKKNHAVAKIKTNGSLLTVEMCKKLKKSGVHTIDVSVYGLGNDIYKKFTGKANYDQVISGIENAIDCGIYVETNIIVHKGNYRDLDKLTNLLNRLGVGRINYGDEITERYDSSTGSKQNELSKHEYTELLTGNLSEIFQTDNKEHALQCSCARSVCGINSNGDVYPCIGAPIPSGNLHKKSFSEIWQNSYELKKIRNLKESDFVQCQKCEYIENCSRSSGSIYANTGNYTGCDDFTLMCSKLRSDNK